MLKNEVKKRKKSYFSDVRVGKYFELPNPGLKSFFGSVVKGSPQIIDTPFAQGEEFSSTLNKWHDELSQGLQNMPTLLEFEEEMQGKVGPMSVRAPLPERMEGIKEYFLEGSKVYPEASEDAIAATVSEWGNHRGLVPRAPRQTLAKMKKSTNSGSPYFAKRRNVISKTFPCKVEQIVETTVQKLPEFIGQACAVLGWRGQEGGPLPSDVKQRVVWMFPFAVNLEELRVYQPLVETAQKYSIIPAWVSMDEVDAHMTKLFSTKSKDDLVVCTDFTAFDQHFNIGMQNTAYRCLEQILAPNSLTANWLRHIFPIKYNIPLMYNYGCLMRGRHGMGSGSGGTNADETLAHRALQHEAAQAVGAKLNPWSMCLGDDGVISYPGITVDDVVRSYTKHGLEMNTSKQYASTQDATFLRRWYSTTYVIDGICRGVYPSMRALGRLKYMERWMDPEIWSPKMVALRQLSILENCKWHPMKEQLVAFCMKRDKYRLGIDIPGFLENLDNEVKKATAYMPDFLGYTKTLQSEGKPIGINSWWIVKYLKSLK